MMNPARSTKTGGGEKIETEHRDQVPRRRQQKRGGIRTEGNNNSESCEHTAAAGAILDSRTGCAPEGAGGSAFALLASLTSLFHDTMVVSPGLRSTENLCRWPDDALAASSAGAWAEEEATGGGPAGGKEEDPRPELGTAPFSSSIEEAGTEPVKARAEGPR